MSEKPLTTVERIFKTMSAKQPLEDRGRLVIEMLNFITALYLISFLAAVLSALVLGGNETWQSLPSALIKGGPVVLMLLIAQGIARSGNTRAASVFLVTILWINTLYQSYSSGGVGSAEYAVYMMITVMAGLFLGMYGAMVTGGTALLAGIVLFILGNLGKLPPVTIANTNLVLFSGLIRLILVAGLLYLFLRQLNEALYRLNKANEDLSKAGQVLEGRVAERTRALALSADISRRLSTILNLSELVREVVNLLQRAFNYYHVHIYLFDETRQKLMMVGGTGEAGEVMLSRGHQVQAGAGLVGRAAETNQPILVSDTLQDPGWLLNPLLPDTRSELAVPIAIGNQVMGVLDVQQNAVGGLSQADADLVQSVASQVAIAVQNARSFTETQQLAERQANTGKIIQRIQRATSIDEVLQVAVSELGRTFGARQANVELDPRAMRDLGQN